MTDLERNYILDVIENDGFEYTFRYKHNFEEIKDDLFHHYLDNYLHAANVLETYLGDTDFD